MTRAAISTIVDVIETNSPTATSDLQQLWRRIAFSILISNTDDQLRNHGFLRASSAGWSLSPAFDLNPDPRPGPKFLHTAIDLDTTEARIDVLMEVADYFRLPSADAQETLAEVVTATSGWQAVAAGVGLPSTELDRMAPAFEHHGAVIARQLTGAAA